MTPWPALLRLAATRFALGPAAFWRLSVAEWRALADETPDSLTRAAFEALARAHPDPET